MPLAPRRCPGYWQNRISGAQSPRKSPWARSASACRWAWEVPGWSGQYPGAVAAGQPVPQQGAQVDRGAPVVQPGVVFSGSDVAESDPAAVLGRGPGDDPLDRGARGIGFFEFLGAGL